MLFLTMLIATTGVSASFHTSPTLKGCKNAICPLIATLPCNSTTQFTNPTSACCSNLHTCVNCVNKPSSGLCASGSYVVSKSVKNNTCTFGCASCPTVSACPCGDKPILDKTLVATLCPQYSCPAKPSCVPCSSLNWFQRWYTKCY
jgi:hypothetical protein